MAIKLDISKAFDKVEWDFLAAIMKKMGFADQWITWIMTCVTSVSYSVLLNGILTKKFFPTRGIRQGDPLSPYLYLICTEGLSRLLQQYYSKNKLTGYKASRSGPAISHLFFADDSLLFTRATNQDARLIKKLLSMYGEASGQYVNFTKSSLMFSKGTQQWDVDKLFFYFHADDVQEILKLRPSIANVIDSLVWIHSKSGTYNVKNGYYMQRNWRKESQPNQYTDYPQEKLHLFKKEQLYKRKLLQDATCYNCGEGNESTNHMLFQCRVAKEMWNFIPSLSNTG